MPKQFYIATPLDKPLPPVVCSFELSIPFEPSLPNYRFSKAYPTKQHAQRALDEMKRRAKAKINALSMFQYQEQGK
jgi:hypothetical protein